MGAPRLPLPAVQPGGEAARLAKQPEIDAKAALDAADNMARTKVAAPANNNRNAKVYDKNDQQNEKDVRRLGRSKVPPLRNGPWKPR
jgi:hypothetical protein